MFDIPLYHFKVNNWDQKKKKLLKLYNSFTSDFVEESGHNLITNYAQESYLKTIDLAKEVFADEIKKFLQELKERVTCSLEDAWFEKAKKGGYHPMHNHGALGYSSVCFINYDESEHTPTTFLSPFNDFINGANLLYAPNNVKEGSIIFFPSVIVHCTQPNPSNKERLIISFNLNVEYF